MPRIKSLIMSHLQSSSDIDTSFAMLSETDKVQSYVSTLAIYESLLNTIPAIIFALALGPWSEKNAENRWPTIGFLVSLVIYATVHNVEFSPAEFLLLAGFSYSLFGSLGTFDLALKRYNFINCISFYLQIENKITKIIFWIFYI